MHKLLIKFSLCFFYFASCFLLLAPNAHACAVCFSSTGSNRLFYFLTTILLTFLPLTMIGGVIYWIKRRVRS